MLIIFILNDFILIILSIFLNDLILQKIISLYNKIRLNQLKKCLIQSKSLDYIVIKSKVDIFYIINKQLFIMRNKLNKSN